MAPTLFSCSADAPPPVNGLSPSQCTTLEGETGTRLCASLARLHNSTAVEMASPQHLADILTHIGRPHHRGSQSGFWHDPVQLAHLFSHLWKRSSTESGRAPSPLRLVFTGAQNGWTAFPLAALLHRCSGWVSGVMTDDVRPERTMTRSARKLLGALNLTFEYWNGPALNGSQMASELGVRVPFDVCFLSGGRFAKVETQYLALAPWCGMMVFYGTNEYAVAQLDTPTTTTVGGISPPGGATPAFWSLLLDEAPASRTFEINGGSSSSASLSTDATTAHAPFVPPSGGIGILTASEQGDALTSRPVSEWAAWQRSGPASLWRHLCVNRKHFCRGDEVSSYSNVRR